MTKAKLIYLQRVYIRDSCDSEEETKNVAKKERGAAHEKGGRRQAKGGRPAPLKWTSENTDPK